jgi:hypothetical protein
MKVSRIFAMPPSSRAIIDVSIFELQQRAQFRFVEFTYSFAHVLGQQKRGRRRRAPNSASYPRESELLVERQRELALFIRPELSADAVWTKLSAADAGLPPLQNDYLLCALRA